MPLERRHLAAAAAVAALLALLWLYRAEAVEGLRRFVLWVDGLGGWGPPAFVAVFAIGVLVLIPASLFYLAAGLVFGLGGGTLYGFVGSALGGACAFLVARALARAPVERWLAKGDRLEALDRALRREGVGTVLLIRLSPLLPAWLVSYGLGVTSVRFRDYLLASPAVLPTTFLYAYYGKALGDLAGLREGLDRGIGYYVALVAGAVATLVATTAVTRRARAILERRDDPAPCAGDEPGDG